MYRYKANSGLSLIEIMVAMALGIFLLAGIVQVFLGSKQSFNVINAQSHMQENGRFALEFMTSVVRHAGYINVSSAEDNPQQFVTDFFNAVNTTSEGGNDAWPAGGEFQSDAFLAGADDGGGVTEAKADTDVLWLRMQGADDEKLLDCEGAELPADVLQDILFYVNGNNELVCRGVNGDDVVLVEGVQDMQVQYGVATASTDPTLAGKYVSASDMTVDDWASIVAVRIALLAISNEETLEKQSMEYDLLDKQDVAYTDGRARQVFTQTIGIRNKLN